MFWQVKLLSPGTFTRFEERKTTLLKSALNIYNSKGDRWTDRGNRSVTKSSGLGEKAAPPCTLMKSRKKRRINSECRSLEDWTDLSRRTANSRDMGEEQTLCSPSHGRSPPIMRLLNCTSVFILFRIRTFVLPHLGPRSPCVASVAPRAIRLFHYPVWMGKNCRRD